MQRNVTLSRILFAAGSLVVVALLVLAAIFIRSKVFKTAEITQTGVLPLSESADIYAFNGGFVYTDGTRLVFTDAAGKEKKVEILDARAEMIAVASKSVMVYYNEQMKIVFPTNESTYVKPLNIVIADIACSTNQDYVAILNEERDTVYILSNKGDKIDTIVLPGQTIANMGFYPGSELLWVVSLNSAGSEPVSAVRLYEPTKSEIALRQFTDEIVYNIVINTGKTWALALGTQYITPIDITGRSMPDYSGVLVYGYQYLAGSDTGGAVLLAPAGEIEKGYISTLRIVVGSGAVNVQLPANCTAFAVGGKNIYAADSATIYTIGYDGQIKDIKTLDGIFGSVLAISNQNMIFYGESGAVIVTLPD